MAIGVGGMVGGGIFAVLGLSVSMARGGTPVAFLLAGLVALVTSYSYAKLSLAFPSRGGTVEFINRSFGPGPVTGSLNVLLWISYVVMLALYAYAFGGYGASFVGSGQHALLRRILASAVVLVLTGLNAAGARAVGRAETWIVGAKIAILGLFVGVGTAGVSPGSLAPDHWAPAVPLVAGGMMVFLAYEGFELIANTAADVDDPERTLPRSYFASVGFVIVLYVLVSAVAVGNLSPERIAAASDYALAEAARPFLGNAGFALVAIAALLSTGSAINATLYGASRVSYIIAKEGELPAVLEEKVWNRPLEGLLLTAALTLLLVNVLDLSSISVMGSAGFLVVFAAVNASGWRLAERCGARRWLCAAGVVSTLGALAALIWQTARETPTRLLVLAAMVTVAVAVELAYRGLSGKRLSVTFDPPRRGD